MLDSLYAFLDSLTLLQVVRDILDIFIVYYIVYRALLVLRGTRAMQVGVGLAMVFVLYIVAQLLQLVTVLNIMGALISSMILIIVVVFQNDIRRGLQRVGSRAWFGGLVRTQESKLIDAVVEAATDLARHRIGALITFEQDANLDEFVGVHKGHVIDAQVTRELLVTLFIPEGVNKLHDGSVIIRNYRIAKAGVFFPMPEGRVVDDSFGSRHRAALGITEETDAVVVIVSEERGTISFCFNGNIASNLDGAKLRTMLEAIFSPKVRKKSRKASPKAQRDSALDVPLSRRADSVGSRRSGDAPESTRHPRRSSEPELAHPRISLAEPPDPSPVRPRVRPTSDAPPPLRPSLTPPPPIVIAPLRTPITTSAEPRTRRASDPDASDDPSDDGSRQSEP
jgi:uncharacterized protein (TIGR00159 family)